MACAQVGGAGGVSASPIRGRLRVPCGGVRRAVGASWKRRSAAGRTPKIASSESQLSAAVIVCATGERGCSFTRNGVGSLVVMAGRARGNDDSGVRANPSCSCSGLRSATRVGRRIGGCPDGMFLQPL
jgi:hypothetical protein